MSIKRLKIALADDPIYTKQMNKINRMEIKDELWLDELTRLHAARDIRALNSTALLQSSQKISIDNNIDNQTVRSRCVEIKIRSLKQLIIYKKALKFLKRYIPAKFPGLLKQYFGTITERKAAVAYVLSDLDDQIDRLDHVVDIANIIIEDCDAAGFTLKRINEMLEQKSRDR